MKKVVDSVGLYGLDYKSFNLWKRSKKYAMLQRYENSRGVISIKKFVDDANLLTLNDLIYLEYTDFWNKLYSFVEYDDGLEGEVEEAVSEIENEFRNIKQSFKKYSQSKIKHLHGVQKVIDRYKLSKNEVDILYYFLTRECTGSVMFYFLENNYENVYHKISIITGIKLVNVKKYLIKKSKLISNGLIVKNNNGLTTSEKLEQAVLGNKLKKRREAYNEELLRYFEDRNAKKTNSLSSSITVPRCSDEVALKKCRNVLEIKILSNYIYGKRVHVTLSKEKVSENLVLSKEFQKIIHNLALFPCVTHKKYDKEIEKCTALFKYQDVVKSANALLDRDNSILLEILQQK